MKKVAAWIGAGLLIGLAVCSLQWSLKTAIVGVAEAGPEISSRVQSAVILPTVADSAGVLLQVPGDGRTIQIKGLTVWYDNAANTNPVYVGIVTANAAQTRVIWFGKVMVTSGIEGVGYTDLELRIPAATAQAGVRMFISAAASDTLEAIAQYVVIRDE